MRGILSQAYALASQELMNCVMDIGIAAGTHHFVDLWARDSLFACFGAFSLGKHTWVKTTLETFLRYQRSDGLIPYRVLRSPTTLGKYRGHPIYYTHPVANFRSHQTGGIVPDGSLMTMITACMYIEKTKDTLFLRKYYIPLTLARRWYQRHFRDGLIHEWFLCEWMDAVLKSGHTLYTNILYWKSLGDMARLSKMIGDHKEARICYRQQNMVGLAIRKTFWNGIYFSDWVDYKRHDHMSTMGNLLAVVFGYVNRTERDSILRVICARCLQGFTLKSTHPRYSWWRIPLHAYFLGLSQYHNGYLWLQPGLLYTAALALSGRKSEASAQLTATANKILEYRGIYEVYTKTGKPLKTWVYQAEHPFAWSSGLFCWVYKLLRSL